MINKGIGLMGNQIHEKQGIGLLVTKTDSLHIFLTVCIPPSVYFFYLWYRTQKYDNDISSTDAVFHITLTSFRPPNCT
jgi:hypothetical protein